MLQSIRQEPGVSLRALLPQAEFVGARDVRVSSCSADSRQCLPGDLFVALCGTRTDGHEFTADAVARGAAAVLAEQLPPVGGVPVCLVSDTRQAYGELCQALAGNPSSGLKVIGVTGTNGKTTTSQLIAHVLEAAGHRVGTLGTLGYCDSEETAQATLTTPSAPGLAHWLQRMQSNGCTHAVMEVSSHALAQRRVAGIEFDAVCVTNVRHDHLDFHGSLANYRAAKARIFAQLSSGGFAVVNADDPICRQYLEHLNCPTLAVGLQDNPQLTGTIVERLKSEQTFLLSAGNETIPVRTQMIGDHHVANCLMAAAVGLAYGIDLSTVVHGIETLGHVPGRLERIECGQPFGVFVDYAHTPDALATSLDVLREVTPGRLICVFGAGGDRDATKRPLMGRAVESRADVCIVTADNPRHEDPRAIVRDILAGLEQPSRAKVIADRKQAIHRALAAAEPEDCVLIAGKGHEQCQIIGNARYAFDDCDVARRWLYNLEPTTAGRHSEAWMALGNS